MNIKIRVFASVRSGNHEGLSFDREANVAKEAFVKDAVDLLAIVNAAVRLADHTRPSRGYLGFRH